MAEAAKLAVNTATPSRPATERARVDNNAINRAIRRAARFTDVNRHNDARITLARAFNYGDLEAGYRAVRRQHERAGYLTPELQSRRSELDSRFDARVRDDYGEDMLRRVNRGL